jgi:hypothetical protein
MYITHMSQIVEGICLLFFVVVRTGYSPHTGYGMVVQPEYANGGYHGYGANPYQCTGPYGAGPGVYPTITGPYSPSTTSCYAMPPPQHIPQHDKLLSKDG